MRVHEMIREFYPQYYSIEHYPAEKTAHFSKVANEWGIFSNFAHAPILHDGITFDCSERLFQYLKFLPESENGKAELLAQPAGLKLKKHLRKMANEHPELFRQDWGAIIVDAMRYCLVLKYQQCEAFRLELERSKGLYIVEDQTSFPTKNADSWGTKLVNNEYVGPNLLGRLLMELRENPEEFAQGIAHMKF